MQPDLATSELVRQLRRVGLRPSARTIEAIKAHGADAVGPLMELALDVNTLLGDEPGSLGPVHALRLLGELRPLVAAEPILRQLPLPPHEEPRQAVFLWSHEAPQIVANFGAGVLPVVLRIADDMDAPPLQRGAAFTTLGFLATTTPELREEIITELRTRLRSEPNATAKGHIVATLAQLKARDAYDEIMELYRNKMVDKSVMPAASARQLMLGSEQQQQLECALHTLDERYEQHGPYSEEQQRAMAELARSQGY